MHHNLQQKESFVITFRIIYRGRSKASVTTYTRSCKLDSSNAILSLHFAARRGNSRRQSPSRDSVRKVSLQFYPRDAGRPAGKSCRIAKDEVGKRTSIAARRAVFVGGRDSARRAAARIHIHISKLAPHGPLCR